MITEEQYKAAIYENEKSQNTINEYHKQKDSAFKEKWSLFEAGKFHFTDDDLIYSAGARCSKCSAGLAYPKDCTGNHQWTCSNVLKGVGTDNGHEAFPFAFYSIKSEGQPSAYGCTTRPKLS